VLCYHFVDSSSSRYVFRAKKIAVQEYISEKTLRIGMSNHLSQSSRFIFRAKKIPYQ
jgi:hypothetical protein